MRRAIVLGLVWLCGITGAASAQRINALTLRLRHADAYAFVQKVGGQEGVTALRLVSLTARDRHTLLARGDSYALDDLKLRVSMAEKGDKLRMVKLRMQMSEVRHEEQGTRTEETEPISFEVPEDITPPAQPLVTPHGNVMFVEVTAHSNPDGSLRLKLRCAEVDQNGAVTLRDGSRTLAKGQQFLRFSFSDFRTRFLNEKGIVDPRPGKRTDGSLQFTLD